MQLGGREKRNESHLGSCLKGLLESGLQGRQHRRGVRGGSDLRVPRERWVCNGYASQKAGKKKDLKEEKTRCKNAGRKGAFLIGASVIPGETVELGNLQPRSEWLTD